MTTPLLRRSMPSQQACYLGGRTSWIPENVFLPKTHHYPSGALQFAGLSLVPRDVVRDLLDPVISVVPCFQLTATLAPISPVPEVPVAEDRDASP